MDLSQILSRQPLGRQQMIRMARAHQRAQPLRLAPLHALILVDAFKAVLRHHEADFQRLLLEGRDQRLAGGIDIGVLQVQHGAVFGPLGLIREHISRLQAHIVVLTGGLRGLLRGPSGRHIALDHL